MPKNDIPSSVLKMSPEEVTALAVLAPRLKKLCKLSDALIDAEVDGDVYQQRISIACYNLAKAAKAAKRIQRLIEVAS